MNRRVGPLIAALIVAIGVYWALDRFSPKIPGPTPRATQTQAPAPPKPESRPASRPQSRPETIATSRFVETQPESKPESAPVDAVAVIEAVREDGRIIAGAHIDAVATRQPWGRDGRAEVPAQPGRTVALNVSGPNFVAVDAEVPLDSGTHRIVVPNGARVAGTIRIDGETPEAPLHIWIAAASPDENDWLVSYLSTVTDEQGGFEFFNLPINWHGVLGVPCAYAFPGQFDDPRPENDPCAPSRRELTAANPNLGINLTSFPCIKGRIAGSPNGLGIARAAFAIDGDVSRSTAPTQGSGVFRILVPPGARSAVVEVADQAGLGSKTIDVPGPLDGVRDLGTIELGATRQIRLRVQDREGAPIAGAIAAVPDTQSVSALTDDEGAADLRVNAGRGEIRVAKIGYVTATVVIPEETTEPLTVELAPGNVLVIEARLPNESLVTRASIFLRSAEPMFAGTSGMSDELHTRTAGTMSSEETVSDHESSIRFSAAHERIVVAGFRPGARVTVQLRGDMLDELIDESFVVMDAIGTKTVQLRAPRGPQEFEGRVRTLDGAPVDGAFVSLAAPEAEDPDADVESGEDGMFRLFDVYGNVANVHIEKEGFVPLTLKNVLVPPPGTWRDFILTPSHDVTILLVDESGRPLREPAHVVVVPLVAWGQGHEATLRSEERAEYVAKGLPPGNCQIRVSVGDTHVSVDQDARASVVRVVVPDEGYVTLRWQRPPGETRRCRFVILSYTMTALANVIDLPEDAGDHRVDYVDTPGNACLVWVEAEDPNTGEWAEISAASWLWVYAHARTVVEVGKE